MTHDSQNMLPFFQPHALALRSLLVHTGDVMMMMGWLRVHPLPQHLGPSLSRFLCHPVCQLAHLGNGVQNNTLSSLKTMWRIQDSTQILFSHVIQVGAMSC